MSSDVLPCFECLRRRIESDISPDIVFLYGISDSALNFGSAAVVQICSSDTEENAVSSEDASAQIVIVQLLDHQNRFLEVRTEENAQHQEIKYSSKKSLCEDELKADIVRTGVAPSNHCEDGPSLLHISGKNLESSSINSSEKFLCLKILSVLSPHAIACQSSFSAISDLFQKYLSGSTEDYVISSLNAFVEGESADQYSLNFLRLVGFPSFGVNSIQRCLRHPNIAPLLGVINAPDYDYLLQPKAPFTLEDILHYSPNSLKSDWHIRFLIYQIFSALTYIHDLGIAHGNLCPSSILLSGSLWAWLSLADMSIMKHRISGNRQISSFSEGHHRIDRCPCQTIHSNLQLSVSMDWHSNFLKWWKGELSNYEYLLFLNKLAGRRWGDHTFHTVMPWVIDFSVKPDEKSDIGWRDLKKSKWRLAKGDEQLDFTYSTSEIPHHVSDECLSELAVCSYKARRLPLKILRSAVRSVYEPNEYPSNMQRLYQWTPDECIPEFYSDPHIFYSIHSEMSDLAVPSWASSPEEFILEHRSALESDRVSKYIHHWIDITFGYKLSGEASIAEKNVMLPVSDTSVPRSTGRRQLFTRPHPMRRPLKSWSDYNSNKEGNNIQQRVQNEGMVNASERSDLGYALLSSANQYHLSDSDYLENLEEATLFCEAARSLNPVYNYDKNLAGKFPLVDFLHSVYPNMDKSTPNIWGRASDADDDSDAVIDNIYWNMGDLETAGKSSSMPLPFGLGDLLDFFESDDNSSTGFQELLHWRHLSSPSADYSEDLAGDVFSIGCIMAELYLRKPLFDPISLCAYKENGVLPGAMQELPPCIAVLVEAAIQRDWKRRLAAKCFLESPYFSASVRGVYLFLAPLQLLSRPGYRLRYAARLASEGAFRAMGPYAAEMCASYCLPLIMSALSDFEAESALCLLKEFLKCLNSLTNRELLLPTIQKILQASEYSHLKVSILQESFVRDLWKQMGKQAYLESIHPLVISNLYNSPNKVSASVASVVLIGSSEELGIPITIHQTLLPVIHCFGKGLSADGIDALVRIGGLLGENFIVRQLLPLIRNLVLTCIDASYMNKPEPIRSWIGLALIDCFSFLDGLVSLLPQEIILKELIQEQTCLHVKVLMQTHLDLPVLQATASALIAVSQRIGSDSTASFIIPQLKVIFDALAFSQPTTSEAGSSGKNSKILASKSEEKIQIGSRMDLVLFLYPSFACLIGIERLRQCCSTWFLLEQILNRDHNWQWNSIGEKSRRIGGNTNFQRLNANISLSEYNPAKLLLNGVGWSVPQSKGVLGGMNMMNCNQENELQQSSSKPSIAPSLEQNEPWFWFPGSDFSSDLPDFLGRTGSLKEEYPWKIKASILYSTRAHPGVLRSLAVCHDEATIYTGGVGPGFKGSIQKWELPRMNCISGYYGHDEVVNSICVLSVCERIASCDGTIHIWNGQSGKLITAYSESSVNFAHHVAATTAKVTAEQVNMLTPYSLSGGLLSNAFSGNLYTCMHHLESNHKLIAGMGNGSIR
ncbi:protein GFS12 isoform X1 [Dendrobium catenatum]|uniref:protein GFS12 isoform X1 n=1 Tax=Dendrobium catenatum TaxID=906689 RepID=UPI0010A050BA|nr:protein GFS12 isoform X1 [Dendrobium catenatum]